MKMAFSAPIVLAISSSAFGADLPSEVMLEVPEGHRVITSVQSTARGRTFYIVALRSDKEFDSESYLRRLDDGYPRPLLIFERTEDGVKPVGRNDQVIARVDDAGLAGNECDPFEGNPISTGEGYFTIQNSVACGAHWTESVTFRFAPGVGYVFDSRRFQTWEMNQSPDPEAEALVPGIDSEVRASPDQKVLFSDWRRP